GITQVPDIFSWIVRRSKGIARFRPTHDAHHINDAVRRALDTGARIPVIVRHETTIDENNTAPGEARRRKYPIAWPLHIRTQGRTRRVNQCLLAIEEFSGKGHTTEFFAILAKPRPARARRQIFWRLAEAGVESRDQIFFPDLAVKLPDTESAQNNNADQRGDGRVEHTACLLSSNLFFHASPRYSRRPSTALWCYCNAIKRPLTSGGGTRVTTRISGSHNAAWTQ